MPCCVPKKFKYFFFNIVKNCVIQSITCLFQSVLLKKEVEEETDKLETILCRLTSFVTPVCLLGDCFVFTESLQFMYFSEYL